MRNKYLIVRLDQLNTRLDQLNTRPSHARCLPMCTGTHVFNEGKNRSYLTLHMTFVDLVKIVPDPRVPVHTGKQHVAGSCVQLVESVCSTGRVVSSIGRVVVWSITRYLLRILPFRRPSVIGWIAPLHPPPRVPPPCGDVRRPSGVFAGARVVCRSGGRYTGQHWSK